MQKKLFRTLLIKKTLVLVFIAVAMSTLFSCGKDGLLGKDGEEGVAGPAGSTIHSGTGGPGAVGSNGDFYLDLSSGRLYGPKSSAGWGGGLSLMGEDGSTGASGNTILSGSGEPDSELGATGDYYLDKDVFNFYGPKQTSDWGVPTALQGPQGPMGNSHVKIDVFSVRQSDWETGGQYRSTYSVLSAHVKNTKYFDRASAVLNPDFIRGDGIVMVYFNSAIGRPDLWSPLPFVNHSVPNTAAPGSRFNVHWTYETMEGNLRLHLYVTQEEGSGLPDLDTFSVANAGYKIVYITGELMANLPGRVDRTNPESIAKYLGVVSQDW